jgi:DNA-binding NarL/FixJ family response regulator
MRALIVDDHPLVQDAIRGVLRRLVPDMTIEAATNCEDGLGLASAGREPDLVLLDLALPGTSGIAAVRLWRQRRAGTAVVVFSATADAQTVLAAMGAGAAGFIPKSSSNEVIENALRLVLAGGRYVPPEVLDAATASRRPRVDALSVDLLGLSARQIEVLRLLARGAPNKTICRELGLAERTVKAHLTALFRALKVTSRTQAAIEAARLGLVDGTRPS